MKPRRFVLSAAFALLFLLVCIGPAHAEATVSCPANTYDMLDWMTMDTGLRLSEHLSGTANPLYTLVLPDKFYWTKGGNGYPWDIQLYDGNYIYLWITEYAWGDPQSYKKFLYNTNMPLAPRCAQAGFPGSTTTVNDTSYAIFTDCNNYTVHDLKKAVNQVWGPYSYSLGGNLPKNLPTLVLSYRYNCDDNYANCTDKEEYYLAQQYGLVQWVHYSLINGSYQQQQKSVFNKLSASTAVAQFQCF